MGLLNMIFRNKKCVLCGAKLPDWYNDEDDDREEYNKCPECKEKEIKAFREKHPLQEREIKILERIPINKKEPETRYIIEKDWDI